MPVPRLTHLQFYVLASLLREPLAGRTVRARLRDVKVRQSAPGFYQMMATLEDSGFVTGWYEQGLTIVVAVIVQRVEYAHMGAHESTSVHSRVARPGATAGSEPVQHGRLRGCGVLPRQCLGARGNVPERRCCGTLWLWTREK
jgi:hypothetical protein